MTRPAGRLRALVPDVLRTEPQFRLLFAGQALSLVGDRVMLVALPFAVLEAGGGLGAVGLVVAAELVPFLVFAVVGGVVADRGDRRRVLVASDVARLVVQAIGGALLLADAATPLTLGVLAALYGTADAFFQPAFTGLLPQTVSHPGQLQPANALRGLSFSVSSIAGPALAGVFVGAIGAGAAMLFDAGSFAVSVALLLRLRPRVAAEGTEEAPPPFREAVHAGWREVRSRRWIVAGLGAMCAYHGIVLPAVFVLGPVSVSERLGGPGAWAAIAVSFGIGSVLGDLLLLRIRPRHALRVAGIALIAASCQAAVYGSGLGLLGMCVLQCGAGVGVTAFFTLWEVSLQEHVPGEALSRVSSFDYLSATALMPVGTALAGPIATALGTQATLVGMSAIGVACALAFLSVREVRDLPRVDEAQPVG
jgi:Transmembrane secretion effector